MLATVVINATLRPRRVLRNGREYLVAGATLLVSGVLNGSGGPLYYPPEEIEANPTDWDGIPIVVYHPMSEDGQPISANSAAVLEAQGIGFVADTIAKVGRLKAKLWFDVAKTRTVDPRVLSSLQRGERIELSTGLGTQRHPAPPGATDDRGRPYIGIAREYAPDHLAILPDEVGACSLNDGCGVLANQYTPITNGCTCLNSSRGGRVGDWEELSSWSPFSSISVLAINSSLVANPKGQWQPPSAGDAPSEVKAILRKVYSAYRDKNPKEDPKVKAKGAKIAWAAVHKAGWDKGEDGQWHKVSNMSQKDVSQVLKPWEELSPATVANSSSMSLDEVQMAVRRAFRAAYPTKYDPDTGSPIDPCYVVDVFSDYFVYAENYDTLYRQSFALDNDGRVTIADDAEPVRRTITYVPLESA